MLRIPDSARSAGELDRAGTGKRQPVRSDSRCDDPIRFDIDGLDLEDRECYFWETHFGAESDLVGRQGSELRGIEVKRFAAPSVAKSMQAARAELGLSRIDEIHAGKQSFPVAKRIRAVPQRKSIRISNAFAIGRPGALGVGDCR